MELSFTMMTRFIVGQMRVSLIPFLNTMDVQCDTSGVAEEGSGRKRYTCRARPCVKNISLPSLLKPRWSTSVAPVSGAVVADWTDISNAVSPGCTASTHNEPLRPARAHPLQQGHRSQTLSRQRLVASFPTREYGLRRHNHRLPGIDHSETMTSV